jgi:hypothetical protein
LIVNVSLSRSYQFLHDFYCPFYHFIFSLIILSFVPLLQRCL